MDKLKKILKKTQTPVKSEQEWNSIERDIFSKLDTSKKRSLVSGYIWKTGAVAAAAAVLILLVTPSYIGRNQIKNHGLPEMLSTDTSESKSEVNRYVKTSDISAGRSYSTPSGRSLFIKINRESGIILYPESNLRVLGSSGKEISLFIDNGRILASISKKDDNPDILVFTEDTRSRITGTIFSISRNTDKTTLSVIEGSVEFSAYPLDSSKISVTAGSVCSYKDQGLECSEFNDSLRHMDITMLRQIIQSGNDSCGYLRITSVPENACISIDNRPAGNSPLLIPSTPGNHLLTVKKTGFSVWRDSFTINSNSVISISPRLESNDPSTQKRRGYPLAKDENTGKILRNRPEYIEAKVQMIMGFYPKALTIFEELYKNPEIPLKDKKVITSEINRCYQGMGRYNKKAEHIKQLLQEPDSDKPGLLWESANINGKCLGEFGKAVSDLREYLELREGNVWKRQALKRLCEYTFFMGEYQEAAQTALKGEKKYPQDKQFLYYYMLINRKYLSAPEKALKAAGEDISDPGIIHELSRCYSQIRDKNRSEKLFKRYLELNPDGYFAGDFR